MADRSTVIAGLGLLLRRIKTIGHRYGVKAKCHPTKASRWALQRTQYGDPKGVLEISRDITEQTRVEHLLHAEAERMEQVAQFGKRALANRDFAAILHDATNLIMRNLHVEFSGVFDHLDEQDLLLLRGGVGWHDDAVQHAVVPAGNGSLPGHAMEARGSVVSAEVESNPRFRVTQLELDHHIVSAIAAVIYCDCGQNPMGVLMAETTKRRVFNWKEVHFLEAIANIVGLAASGRGSKSSCQSAQEPGNGKVAQPVGAGRLPNAGSWGDMLNA